MVHYAFHGTNIQLTAVGDTKQRIMGWAGALEGIFETFAPISSLAPSLNLYAKLSVAAALASYAERDGKGDGPASGRAG